MPARYLAILGPTATGKSALALALAERLDGEIINCDSTAVYRGFDIGTDKVPVADRRGIPHHLIDIVDPTDEYTAARFARDAAPVIRDIHGARPPADPGRRHRPLLPRADARAVSRSAGRAPRCARGSSAVGGAARHRVAAPYAAARRPAVGRAHSAARPQADGSRARGLLR